MFDANPSIQSFLGSESSQSHSQTHIEAGGLYVSLARNQNEVAEAQRLRYQVFAEEMGAPIKNKQGLDVDGFDQFCDHLLVRERDSQLVVGTYRILNPIQAMLAGGYYSAGEFDLTRLEPLFDRTVEVGRACVHADYRRGGAITLLWAGLARYMMERGYEYMLGCASMSMQDGGHHATSLYHQLKDEHLSPPEYRVFPHTPLPMQALKQDLETTCPPLIKGYLRLGAYICGEPAWDASFNTADLLVLLPLSQINPRYAAHFLK
jgi:putative hemolysin